MGIGGSMLWWEEGSCRMLAGGRRFVIRYERRDTGRSVTYQRGHPQYTGAELLADAVGVLDAYGIPVAHIVGVSAGGAFAQLLAVDYPHPRALACPDQHLSRDAGRSGASRADRGVRAIRVNRARGLVRRQLGDRLHGQLHADARGELPPVR
jgi:pimeloyl-ACP methyl ester carboxylesterase